MSMTTFTTPAIDTNDPAHQRGVLATRRIIHGLTGKPVVSKRWEPITDGPAAGQERIVYIVHWFGGRRVRISRDLLETADPRLVKKLPQGFIRIGVYLLKVLRYDRATDAYVAKRVNGKIAHV